MTDLAIVGTNGLTAVNADRTPTALTLPEDMTVDQWRDLGRNLLSIGQAVSWWIGDWLNFGERAYGETYTEAAELTGLELSTLAGWKWVAGAVEPCLRRQTLSWSHHELVAAFPPEQQAELLDLAERFEWSHSALRAEVRARRNGGATPSTSTPAALPVVSHSLTVTVAPADENTIKRLLARIAAGVEAQLRIDGIDGKVEMA